MTTTVIVGREQATRGWPAWIFDAILWTLFLGPIVSPLFRATGLPLLEDSGVLARDLLATYICPTPERSMLILGLPMAVCVRCWGAMIGLLAARSLAARHVRDGAPFEPLRAFRELPWAARLLLCAVPFLLWPLEIVAHYGGEWYAPLWVLLVNGAQAGFFAGLLFCSLWPGLWPTRRAA